MSESWRGSYRGGPLRRFQRLYEETADRRDRFAHQDSRIGAYGDSKPQNCHSQVKPSSASDQPIDGCERTFRDAMPAECHGRFISSRPRNYPPQQYLSVSDPSYPPRGPPPLSDQTYPPRGSPPLSDRTYPPRGPSPLSDRTYPPRGPSPLSDRTYPPCGPHPLSTSPGYSSTLSLRPLSSSHFRDKPPEASSNRTAQGESTQTPIFSDQPPVYLRVPPSRPPLSLLSIPPPNRPPLSVPLPDRPPVPPLCTQPPMLLRPLAPRNRPAMLPSVACPLVPPPAVSYATSSSVSPFRYSSMNSLQRFREQTEERRRVQQRINEFISNRPSTKNKNSIIKPPQDPVIIPLVRKDIRSCFEYLALLEKKRNVLEEESDLQMWKWEVSDVEVAMTTISNLMSKLRSPDLRRRMKLKLGKIQKKKNQRMRNKQRIKTGKVECAETLRKLNAETREKREKEERALKQKLQIDEENKDVRAYQGKLKQRQEDVKKCLRIITALSKLRQARIQKRKVESGILSDPERDEAFQKAVDNLNELLQQQMKKYCIEEDDLAARLKSNAKPLLQQVKGYLFGEAPVASHPLYSLYQEFTRAENSLDAFIDIRSQWDAFVVADDHPLGSGIPADWVYRSAD